MNDIEKKNKIKKIDNDPFEDLDEIEIEIENDTCCICGSDIDNLETNPIGNAHYFCWINLPYF